jgi:hypothetical protein
MAVFVLDKQKNPLMSCSEKRARKLPEAQRACTRATACGFSRRYLRRQKTIHSFENDDMVKEVVTKGKKSGHYLDPVAVRATGSSNMQTAHGVIQGISHKDYQLLEWADGYRYSRVAHTSEKERENGACLASRAIASRHSCRGLSRK